MAGLRAADLRTAVDVVAELGETDDFQAFGLGVVAGLQRLIPADAVAYNRIDLRAGSTVVVVDPPETMFAEGKEALLRYGTQNPLVAHAIREPHTQALRISDFIGRREFHRTDIYNTLFRPLGLDYQMACGLPAPRGLVVGVSINRSRQDFSERDRSLLDLLRPHFAQAHGRAIARESARTTISSLENAIDGVGRAAIVLTERGAIHAASPQALRWLKEYFPAAAGEDTLPRPLAAWKAARRANGGAGDDILGLRRGSRRLTVRVVEDQDSHRDLLVFEERDETPPRRLARLGLTARQTEILQLVATGRSDRDIARKLSLSENTVGKHLEHIFARLHVTTRTAAAALAWQATRERDTPEGSVTQIGSGSEPPAHDD